jgi:hypothetical protein
MLAMRKRRSVAIGTAVAGCVAAAALTAPSLFGADATGALANFTLRAGSCA